MLRTVASRVAWVGRTASMVFGLALVMALIFGVVSVGLAANGNPFILGKAANTASKVTGLVKSGAGPALRLKVGAGQPPLAVNSDTKIANLNADKLDGMHASEIGIDSVERHALASANDSVSPKRVSVKCPEGTVLVGNSGYVVGGNTGSSPNGETDVSLVTLDAFAGEAVATAWENDATDANWTVVAVAQCATRP